MVNAKRRKVQEAQYVLRGKMRLVISRNEQELWSLDLEFYVYLKKNKSSPEDKK